MIADLMTQKALDRYHEAGLTGLTEQEKTLAAIWCFESKVANGGFEHFFESAEGELAAFAPVAFRNVGAERRAALADRANAVFGPGGIPPEQQQRARYLEALSAERRKEFTVLEGDYAELDNDLDERLEKYLENTPPPRA